LGGEATFNLKKGGNGKDPVSRGRKRRISERRGGKEQPFEQERNHTEQGSSSFLKNAGMSARRARNNTQTLTEGVSKKTTVGDEGQRRTRSV